VHVEACTACLARSNLEAMSAWGEICQQIRFFCRIEGTQAGLMSPSFVTAEKLHGPVNGSISVGVPASDDDSMSLSHVVSQ